MLLAMLLSYTMQTKWWCAHMDPVHVLPYLWCRSAWLPACQQWGKACCSHNLTVGTSTHEYCWLVTSIVVCACVRLH